MKFLTFVSLGLCLLPSTNWAADVTDYGALCDGATDDIAAFDAAWTDMVSGNIGVLEIHGNCHLSRPWELSGRPEQYKPLLISGWGATLDNTVVLNSSSVSLKGLTVKGAKDGFVFTRGQGASHERLNAVQNSRHGFHFGADTSSDGEKYSKNAQITNVVFTALSSIGNGSHGYYWEDSAEVRFSWFNANTFIQPIARKNIGAPFKTTGSRMNYNTIVSAQFEGNGQIADFSTSGQLTLVGGHFVEKDSLGDSIKLGRYSYMLGGRVVGNVKDKLTDKPFIMVNTATPGEAGRMHYLFGMDVMQ